VTGMDEEPPTIGDERPLLFSALLILHATACIFSRSVKQVERS